MPIEFRNLFSKKAIPIIPSRIKGFYLAGITVAIILLVLQTLLLAILRSENDRMGVNMGVLVVASMASAIILAYAAWSSRQIQPKLYPSWLMLALAMFCNPLAGILGGILTLLIDDLQSTFIINYFILIVYPLFFLMAALLPSRSTRRLELIQWSFDALIVILSVTLIFCLFFVQPDMLMSHKNLELKILSIANGVGDLLILWALVMILFRRLSVQQIEPLLWILCSFSILFIYDLISASLTLHTYGTNYNSFNSFKEILLNASIFSLSIAGLRQLLALKQSPKEAPGFSLINKWETIRLIMPYIGLGVTFGILILSLITPLALSQLVIAIWVAIIFLLVIIRQLLVLRENQNLSRQLFQLNEGLEQRIAERSEALIAANQELLEREIRMAHIALHDALTDLPNRTLLLDRLEQSIRRMRRDPNYSFGVLFMDLDGFKVVNDSLGHISGDKLLVKIAFNLTSCVRDIDTVARLGGDEFVILLDGCVGGDFLIDTAKRIMGMFETPFEIDNHLAYMAASMGIVPGSPDYNEPADVLRDADLAMYEAKAKGKACYIVFTPDLRTYALDRLMLEKDLRLAMEKNELYLNYQPIIDLASGSVLGFEALLRWRHHSLGMISPGTFIPIAESNGMITPITYWVFDQAIRQLSIWKEEFPAFSLSMSVNLSARLFNQPGLMKNLEKLLMDVQLMPQDLILEITESAIIQDTQTAIKILKACQKLGIKVHMDDFGTGYSSLSYLHKFPLNALKVAQDFVIRILPGGENSEIVRTIVSLARDLNLEVIAEGIETREQLEYIRQLGCQGGQGFYISRPLAPADAAKFIARHSAG